jgi:hypothetical protein
MVEILETEIDVEYALGHHVHCLVAQIPVRLRKAEHGWAIADREQQWRTVRSVMDLVAEGWRNLRKLHFLVLPEASVPAGRLDDLLAIVAERFRPNTVTMFGLEAVRVSEYRRLLARFEGEHAAAIAHVDRDLASGDVCDLPVNPCCVVVREASGRLRVFLEAKTHPFRGEEFLDAYRDLYRGRHLWLFRCTPSCFNFMVLVCLDYLWRNLYESNIRRIIDHADRLFFTTRQKLDALFVVQATPKPDHRAYRDVLSGFYGEYLEDTPGVRETVTVFANASDESVIEPYAGPGAFGGSQVVIGPGHKLARVETPEFRTDDFDGAPVGRIRFGAGTRLYYFNLPLHHELDPRSSRLPLKLHGILRLEDHAWTRVASERVGEELADSGEAGS